ncbi:uncharacterized protein DSM5745_11458 [Aspergillus mulundensis]|uniref:Uncharacterized protein n=1 Tax=Aspergillus mulundensis TaxID=1810919 RepID=A0A3D8Q6X4_9EURO|nr:hypothetical protein DSM5745_11458 [Aspergillus mulundensis]RDW57563.1 hypothetical protein DSM5745_11458 [Aspergillus mulundensis]
MDYTVETAITEALKHLKNIEDHLRIHHQSTAANEIGKLSAKIGQAVKEVLLHFPQCANVIDLKHTNGSTADHAYPHHDVKQNASGGHYAMTSHGSPMLQKVWQALENEVRKEQNKLVNKPAHFEGLSLQTLLATPMPAVQPHSYAQVAGSITCPRREVPQLLSPKSMTSFSGSKVGQNSDDSGSIGDLMTFSASPTSEPPEEKAGIILVHGKMNAQMDVSSLRNITSHIKEGPLQEVLVEAHNRARIVFQHFSHASAFYQDDQESIGRDGIGRLGKDYRVELAEIVPWNDNHRLMNQPIRERRRLSFARKGLFSHPRNPIPGTLTREVWDRDMRSIAGPGNTVRLFVFNYGNATAIFTSTVVARKVLETVNEWEKTRTTYRGVSVSYSSDPCEKELNLTKNKCILDRDLDRDRNFNRNFQGGRPNIFRGNTRYMPPRRR